jgi:hypothetical protein
VYRRVIRGVLGYRFDDSWQRRLGLVPRRGELHADRQSRTEEARVLVLDELCKVPAGHGHHGCQHVRQGMYAFSNLS